MRKHSRIWACLLALVVCLQCFPLTAWAAGDVGYYVDGTYDPAAMELTVKVGAQNISDAVIGRIALSFDNSKLTLLRSNGSALGSNFSLNDVVGQDAKVTVTAEGLQAGELISQTEGYVAFAWYARGSFINASDKAAVATLRFKVNDGVTEDDMDRATIRLMANPRVLGKQWYTGAMLKSWSETMYCNNITGVMQCELAFHYPNCTAVPANACDVTLRLQDSEGKPLRGTVYIGSERYMADANGVVAASAVPGACTVKVEAPGYKTVIEEVDLPAASTFGKTYTLRSDAEYLASMAESLAIRYAQGDSAGHVTNHVTLSYEMQDNVTVSWSSSNPAVISSTGIVTRSIWDTNVTLTATLKKGGVTYEKTFELTVIGRSSTIGGGGSSDSGTEVKSGFTDLGYHLWAVEAINAMAEKGIIKGVTDTLFAPGADIKRGDYMALLMRMLDPKGTPGEGFADVPQSSYFYPEITLGKALGVAYGVTETEFAPDAKITRQDMVTLTWRALVKLGYLDENAPQADLKRFKDAGAISDYARQAIAVMVEAGYLHGNTDGTVNSGGNATRAEAAVFLYQIYLVVNG